MKSKYWAILLAVLVIGCLGLSFLLMGGGEPAVWAEIRSDGELTRTVNLNTDQEFVVPCPGGYNTVTVRDGKIAVTEADCPDQYCVRQGFCNSGRQIVCLPHGLVISFVDDGGVDGFVG